MRMSSQWTVPGAERSLYFDDVATNTFSKLREMDPFPFIYLAHIFVTMKQTATYINIYCVFYNFKAPVHFHKNNIYNFMHR